MEGQSDQESTDCDLAEQLKTAENKDDKSKIYELSFQLGMKYCKNDEFDEALKYFLRCLRVAPELRNRELESKAHREIGHVHRLNGDYPEALEHFQKCLKIASLRGNKTLEGQAHLLSGLAHRLMGNYSDAKDQNEKGLKISLDLADRQLQAQAELAMGIVSRLMKKFSQALRHYEKCKNISSRIGDHDNEASAHFGIGVIYKWQEKYSDATKHLEKCLSIAQKIGKRYVEYYANLELGNVYKLKRNYSKAKEYFEKSFKVHKIRGFRQEYLKMGLLCNDLDDPEEALKHFEKHLEILEENNKSTHDQFAETYKYLGDLNDRLGRDDMAKQFREKRKKINEQTVNSRSKRPRISEFEEMMFEVEAVESPVSRPWDEYFENYEETANLLEQGDLGSPSPKWEQKSRMHRSKFQRLIKLIKDHSEKVETVYEVRVCFSGKFCIGKGINGTEVFIGLGKDGYEKAVKRIRKPLEISSTENDEYNPDKQDERMSGGQKLPSGDNEKKILNHQNTQYSEHIVRYWGYDDDTDEQYAFLILDLGEETLEKYVKREKKKDEWSIATPEILKHVLMGLKDLHKEPEQVLHRDVKPTNILRNAVGKWQLADFGISRILANASAHVTTASGTENWMAAELFTSDGELNPDGRYSEKSDIQSAGMVAYYVATKGKHRAFGPRRDRLRNLLNGQPVGLEKIGDPCLKDLLTWMLSLKPEDRPSAEAALWHPYFLSSAEKFEFLATMGNQSEVKKNESCKVVQQLNGSEIDWQNEIDSSIFNYLQNKSYGTESSECLRCMRNANQHLNETRASGSVNLQKKAYEFFAEAEFFSDLSVDVHRIVRLCGWRERSEFEKYFSKDKNIEA